MGLIRALAGATGGVLADQWKEFFLLRSTPCRCTRNKGRKKTWESFF